MKAIQISGLRQMQIVSVPERMSAFVVLTSVPTWARIPW